MSDVVLKRLVQEVVALRQRVAALETLEMLTDHGALTGLSDDDHPQYYQSGDFLTLGPGTTLTIAGGAITVSGSYHGISPEGGSGSDDLDTINGGASNALLVLYASGGVVTLKDATGNLNLAGDCVLASSVDRIMLISAGAGTAWREISRSINA